MSTWGDRETQHFFELTPDRILGAVEKATGRLCTGRALALNSLENRVYEIEIELDEAPATPSDRFLIAKFYRPGRWTIDQIKDEHQFLMELAAEEIPVVAPLVLANGETVGKLPSHELFFAVFPKVGGRSPDELTHLELEQVGRLLARVHAVGSTKKAPHRCLLNPSTYGISNLRHLVDQRLIPSEFQRAYQSVVERICTRIEPLFSDVTIQRIHGDCHKGNLLFGRQGFFFVDFDDMVMGPRVQDLWLLIPGRDQDAKDQIHTLLDAYETMRPFPRHELKLIEPLRALRFIHFSAWIGRRYQDPSFPKAFPDFGAPKYWQREIIDLEEQLRLIDQSQAEHEYQ